MTEAEAVDALRALNVPDDQETGHGKADDLLVQFVRELGYKHLADTYDELSEFFWFA